MQKTVLVTGARGFVGRNLIVLLRKQDDVRLIETDIDSLPEMLETGLREADLIFHLAGVNRPEKPEDYEAGNAGSTKELCEQLQSLNRTPQIIFSSSIQAELENPYGISKRKAEEELLKSATSGAKVFIFRFKNIFGKWCRPNYNSVTATFCHNIAHNLPIAISDPSKELDLVYIDDVCTAMLEAAGFGDQPPVHCIVSPGGFYGEVTPVFKTSLGELASTIQSFRDSRQSLQVPAFDNPFIRRLYATYLSYLDSNDFAYGLDLKKDDRGYLAEVLKASSFGQIFISRTKPGITRGNHYHHTKTEKFLVVQGDALIRFRHIMGDEVIEYHVGGEEFRVVDIPPGYTHSITNMGDGELVTLFWADEIFNPEQPDTFYEEVIL